MFMRQPPRITIFQSMHSSHYKLHSLLIVLFAVMLLLVATSGLGDGIALASNKPPKRYTPTPTQTATATATRTAATKSTGKNTSSNTAVLTYKNDTQRTGDNLNETILNTSNVNSMQFGKHVSYSLDGQEYTQPLYVPGLTIGGNVHNVVFATTQNDSVYAFDADQTSNVAPLWHDSFINPPNVTTVSSNDVSCNDISPQYGITGTPVIDGNSNTLYVVANTKEGSNIIYRLHALDITNGHERPGSPVVIHKPGFDPVHQLQRGGLLLLNGKVYIDFGSHCDNQPYHGWIFAYNATTLQRSSVYNSTASGSEGGIWQSGQGIAADSSGFIYVMTGNGTFDLNSGGVDAGDSFLRLSTQTNLRVVDSFTPFNQSCLSSADADLGSGGNLLLPTQSGPNPNELIGVGKEGRIYVVNRSNMGGYNTIPNVCNNQNVTNVDKIVQEFAPGTIGGVWGSPSYWNGPTAQYVYFGGSTDHLKAYTLTNGRLSTSPTSSTIETFAYPGGDPSLSSDGNTAGTGVLWVIDANGVLHAYDATNVGTELYNSNQNVNRDKLGSYIKFSVPTIANGEVFVGTQNSLVIYGLLQQQFSGSLITQADLPPSTVNLTNEGTADWAHWGLSTTTSFDHKRTLGQQISNYTVIGNSTVHQYNTNPNGYSWTDGTPTDSATNTPTGIWIAGVGDGFKITAPADTTSRTLKVYVGIWRSQGLFTASLSDNSAPVFTDTILYNQSNASIAVYVITYKAASAGQVLTASFTVFNSYYSSGNVTLQAASLVGPLLPPGAVSYNNTGTSNDNDTTAANYDGVGYSYSAQELSRVGLAPGQVVVFNNVTFTWPTPAPGSPNNYQATGQALTINQVSGATTLAFLGSSTNGPSIGNVIITYTDGTTQIIQLGFSDWTLNAGKQPPSYGNQIVATMNYRNGINGKQIVNTYVFYAEFTLTPGKTVLSVDLPATLNQGHLHVFAIGTK